MQWPILLDQNTIENYAKQYVFLDNPQLSGVKGDSTKDYLK